MHRPDPATASALLEHATVGLAACNEQGQVVWSNPALGVLLGADATALAGLPVSDLLGPKVETLDDGVRRAVVSVPTGERRWLELRHSPLPAPLDGIASVVSVTDITAFQGRAKARAAVAAGIEASRLDADTGLLNRRATLQELNAQVSRSRRYGNPLSVIGVRACDDGETADIETRRRVSQHLRESLRWVDSAGALDRETLIVVLPETDFEAARHVANKLAAALLADSECREVAEHISVTAWEQPDDVGAVLDRVREARHATI